MCCRADTCNVLCPFDFMYPFPVRFCHQSHTTRLVAIPCMRRQISKTLPCLQPKSGGTDHVRTTVCILRQSNDAYTIVDRSYLISYMHVQVYAGVAGPPNCGDAASITATVFLTHNEIPICWVPQCKWAHTLVVGYVYNNKMKRNLVK